MKPGFVCDCCRTHFKRDVLLPYEGSHKDIRICPACREDVKDILYFIVKTFDGDFRVQCAMALSRELRQEKRANSTQ